MKIYGIGAFWGDREVDMTDEFVDKKYVQIGWGYKDAPALYKMFEQVQIGDYIYIKSSYKYSELRIKAIGRVEAKEENKCDMDWIFYYNNKKDKKPIKYPLTKQDKRFNVYPFAFYEEYSPAIIKLILDNIKQKDS